MRYTLFIYYQKAITATAFERGKLQSGAFIGNLHANVYFWHRANGKWETKSVESIARTAFSLRGQNDSIDIIKIYTRARLQA